MSKVAVLANIIAKEDKIELLKKELLKLVELSRDEEGCISYILHQDNENLAHFIMYENWENEELLNTHVNNTSFTDYVCATKNAIEEFNVNKMTVLA